MLKLASWNVNSLKVRLPQVLEWMAATDIDILALQETKLTDENFPNGAFEELGLHVVFSGQKTYNGVAIISKAPIHDVVTDIQGFDDPQRRILAATIGGIRVVNLYVPNGEALLSDKYLYKLSWLEHVTQFIASELRSHSKLAVVGDFNIAPADIDVHAPEEWADGVLVSQKERDAFFRILNLGLKDSVRALSSEENLFSWWDYRAAGFRRNRGLRIDHILLSEALMQCCQSAVIDKEPRKNERPSDHAPVFVALQSS